MKKLKFDNQILMQRLGDYKKAERVSKDLCSEYEQMKVKYFNVLTENQHQKTAIADYITREHATGQEIISLKTQNADL